MRATQVETLRKQALAEVGVRQFSAEGLYRDPCVSFVLPDVICTFCNLCRDLDLCRDSRLMDEDEVCAVTCCCCCCCCCFIYYATITAVSAKYCYCWCRCCYPVEGASPLTAICEPGWLDVMILRPHDQQLRNQLYARAGFNHFVFV